MVRTVPTMSAFQCSALLFVLLAAIARSPAGEIADLHQKWIRPRPLDSSAEKQRFEALDQPQHRVTEIGMERTACHGTCPVYTLILKADGTVRYVGEQNVLRIGPRTGQVSVWQFHRLATLAVNSGYLKLQSSYDLPEVADLPTTYTTVVQDGKRKLVRNYGDLGPIELWAFQQAIDSLLLEIQWDDQKKSDGPGNRVP